MSRVGALAMAVAACSGSMPAPSPEPPTIYFMPSDGTTGPVQAIGAGVVEVYQGEASSAQLEAVASGLSLRTWPELDVVQTQAPSMELVSGTKTIQLMPSGALGERWYAVTLEAVPEGMRLPSMPAPRQLPDGGHAALFFNGSAPALRRIAIYSTKPNGMPLELGFSEAVALPTDGSMVATINQAGQVLNCTFGPSPQLLTSWGGACPGADPTSPFVLETGSGLTSAAGKNAAATSSPIDPASLTSCGDSCWFEDLAFSP